MDVAFEIKSSGRLLGERTKRQELKVVMGGDCPRLLQLARCHAFDCMSKLKA